MRHSSIQLDNTCEPINFVPLNPLISKCEIKVCYVSNEPNRNGSIITKEVATEMAKSLPGCPIVGYYNENEKDYEEHNRIIDISNGEFKIKDTTKPYGFVDLNAKVWFQKFLDDNSVEREYLMTEGYLWTGQYPECQRVIDKGNNQSMELENMSGVWTDDNNGYPEFFIVNEALISKLCILGDDFEPCFEGATIKAPSIQFSFEPSFKEQLFSMMEELKELIKGGAEPMFKSYAVEIGNRLWELLYCYVTDNLQNDEYSDSNFWINSLWEDGEQKFAILQDAKNPGVLYRLDFSYNEENGITSNNSLIKVAADYVPVGNVEDGNIFSLEDNLNYQKNLEKNEDKNEKEVLTDFSNNIEDEKEEEIEEKQAQAEEDSSNEEEKNAYSLEEIPEYVELNANFIQLKEDNEKLITELNELKSYKENIEVELNALREFKSSIEKTEKQEMIDSFYMLSEEDKADVLTNIDTYSLDDIEAKLAVICVRKKVNFNLEDSNEKNKKDTTVFNLNADQKDSDPSWIKSIEAAQKKCM